MNGSYEGVRNVYYDIVYIEVFLLQKNIVLN